jgi:copper(I)-binding protein
MKTIVLAAAAAFAFAPLAVATSAFAHAGVDHNGCQSGQSFTLGDITVTDAFTRATLPGAKSGGGFMTITNAGATADKLVGATTKSAKLTQVHQMRMEGDVMKMNEVEGGLEVPAGGSVTLEPGGYHVMMMGLVQALHEGACLEVTLQFQTAGELPVMLSVGGTDADAAPEGHMHH